MAAGKVPMIDVRKPEGLAAGGYVGGSCGVRELPNRVVHGRALYLTHGASCLFACALGRCATALTEMEKLSEYRRGHLQLLKGPT